MFTNDFDRAGIKVEGAIFENYFQSNRPVGPCLLVNTIRPKQQKVNAHCKGSEADKEMFAES